MSTKRVILGVLLALIALSGLLVYLNFDPSDPAQSKFFPKCPVLYLTGFKCPGCGSQRAIHALLNGDMTQAATYNALLLVALPLIALYFIADLIKNKHPQLDNILNHPVAITLLIVLIFVWWIMRNVYGW